MPSLSLGLSLNSSLLGLGDNISISFDVPLSVNDDAATSTVIAQASVSGGEGVYTFTLTDDASGQFSITTGGELSVAAALTAGSQSITISADNGVDDPMVRTPSVSVNSLPVNTVAPVFSGTPEVGETGTTNNGTWTGYPAPTFTYQVERDGVDVSGEEAASYLFAAADDETDVNITVTATNVRGSVSVDSNALSITYAQPVASGALSDQAFTDDTGVSTYDASVDFTGGDLTFSLTTSLTGVTINSTTGVVSFDTDTLAAQSGTSVVVRATNSGGNADSGFGLTISEDLPDAPTFSGPLAAQSFTEDTGDQTFDVSGEFSGVSITYSLISPPTGVTINSSSGVVTFDTDVIAVQSSTTITVRATNGGGSDDGTFSMTVSLAAPVLNGSLTNQSFTEDTGDQTYATAGGFTGSSLTYSLVSPPTGVTISSITGIVTHDSDVLAVQSGTTITVRATNTGGSVDSTYDLTITAAAAGVDPEAGLTLDRSYAPDSAITVFPIDRANPVVMAADFTGLDGSSGGFIADFSVQVGAYIGFRNNGDFVARAGDGGAAWNANTAYVLDTSGVVSGDGTLVVEFVPGTPITARAWWNGVALAAGVDGASQASWSGTAGGDYLRVGTSTATGEVQDPVVTYTTASDLRVYENATSSA